METQTQLNIRELKTTVYYKGGNFDSFSDFFNKVNRPLKSNQKILNLLIKSEIDRLLSQKEEIREIINRYKSTEAFIDSFNTIGETVIKYFSADLQLPQLFLVDTLPVEFGSKPWDSMSVDAKDEVYLGIKKGIYYKKDVLTHSYFEFIIAHELIHWTISQYSNEFDPYINLIEEGVCDYLSYLILLDASILNLECVTNFLIYNRVLEKPNSLWLNYYRFSKFISSVCFTQGLEYLIDTIKKGRREIYKLKFNFDVGNRIEENILHLQTAYNIAESSVVINHVDFYFLSELIKKKYEHFYFSEINEIDIDKKEMKISLTRLVEKNIIRYSSSNDTYSQTFLTLPANIKFMVAAE